MNDGGYKAYSNSVGEAYRNYMKDSLVKIKAAGTIAVVGGPGIVDGLRNSVPADVYNDNLAHLSAIDRELAKDAGFPFANVHGTMMAARTAGRAARGNYGIGGDGVHPGENGHLMMAYAFLKAMGLDGDIGTITVTWDGKAEATAGHRILSDGKGQVEVESSRYPFCFPSASTKGDGVASVLAFVPFQQDLNRLMLVVKGLPGEKAEVKWGQSSKVFTKEQLAAGVNLAAEFLDNPFSVPFGQVMTAVAAKQTLSAVMFLQLNSHLKTFKKNPERMEELAKIRDAKFEEDAKQADAERALVKPVRHQIQIVPLAAGK